jgi:hypothetical protein
MKQVPTQLDLPEDLIDAFRIKSMRDQVSMSAVIRRLLRTGLAHLRRRELLHQDCSDIHDSL